MKDAARGGRSRRWPLIATAIATMLAGAAMPAGAQGAGDKGAGDRSAKGAKATPPSLKIPAGKLPKSPPVPTTFSGLFDERNARAKSALGYLRCFQSTVNALRAGVLGQVPRAWSLTCVQQGAEWRGVFGELTEEAPGIRVHLQYALRGNGVVTNDPVDTARVSGTARALLRGLSAPVPGGGQHEYVPVVLPQKGYTEVWFVPVPGTPARVVTGGDSLIQMSEDGTRELGHSRSAPPIRTFAVQPAGNLYLLESREERVPLLSELLVAHLALDMVADVRIRTNQYESTLSRGARAVRHVQR